MSFLRHSWLRPLKGSMTYICTKAHDMELHLGKRRRPRVVDRLETSVAAIVETKKRVPVVVGAQRPKETKKATMKERLEKKYSFTDDLVEDMFEDLLEQKLITLPDVKRPHEEGKKNDPKYCPYHRLISHPLKDCFFLKDKIQELFDSRVIELPSPEKVTANPITADDDGEGECDDEEEEEESSASSPIHIPDSPIVISDDEEEGSNASCLIHISDFPTSRNLAVGEFMVTPKARVTPEKAMASPKYSHVPPMFYINTPEYVVSP
ncbi:hypothetical protein RHGRI_029178 [Rhododendron griersonianum]|uniref:Retrotransposon gag protein n=1 Tax=Rhododendron griersonianum TaxID=479676 RepID=A0AAV6IIG6_9ERIC|nr:hypothetical protein RHGRI_029178 [Rhododendron griersonianum]